MQHPSTHRRLTQATKAKGNTMLTCKGSSDDVQATDGACL
jgi:hypothetical protein